MAILAIGAIGAIQLWLRLCCAGILVSLCSQRFAVSGSSGLPQRSRFGFASFAYPFLVSSFFPLLTPFLRVSKVLPFSAPPSPR